MNGVKKVAKAIFPNGKIVCESERSIIIKDKKGNEWFFYPTYNNKVAVKCYSIKE